jgi:hypothetical protein
MRWPRPRFTLRRLMVAVAVMAICISVVEYEMRRRRTERLLRLELDARIEALRLAFDKQNALFESRSAVSKRGQVIYAEEWSGNPRSPGRHGLSKLSFEVIRESEELLRKQEELTAKVEELSKSIEQNKQSHSCKPWWTWMSGE